MMDEQRIKILMLAYKLEKGIQELYLIFAERFPRHDRFWLGLAQQEETHAAAVRKLYRMSYDGTAIFRKGNLETSALESITNDIDLRIEEARHGRFSLVQALVLTCDLEKSFLEKQLFSHFSGAGEVGRTIRILQEGTVKHAELAKLEVERFRRLEPGSAPADKKPRQAAAPAPFSLSFFLP